jgi:hypothetical protein
MQAVFGQANQLSRQDMLSRPEVVLGVIRGSKKKMS